MTGWPTALAILVATGLAAVMFRYETIGGSLTSGYYLWDRWHSRFCVVLNGKIACTQGEAKAIVDPPAPPGITVNP